MESLSNLEIKIIQTDEGYKASSEAFPNCVGVGPTPDQAIQTLSSAIATFIASAAKTSIQKMLKSENYTEMLLDQTSDENEQRRIYNLDPNVESMAKILYMKVKKVDTQKKDLEKPADIRELFVPADAHIINKQDVTPTIDAIHRLVNQDEQEALLFGFPLSFN